MELIFDILMGFVTFGSVLVLFASVIAIAIGALYWLFIAMTD